jgi:serine/threonine protein kinase
LESIVLDRDLVHISRLGWCLRYSSEPPADGITAPLPVNSEPQYIPPEFFRNTEVVWDGYATDLWASGLILFSMVVSSHALFSAPVPEDRLFVELCEQGNIKQVVERFGKATKRQLSLSSDLEDLLQKMLKADPAQRLSLDQVMEHAWLKGEEISPWAS